MCYKKENIEFSPRLGKLTAHHRKPRSHKGKSTPHNVSYVPERLHESYHHLFINFTPQKIADILNRHWIDPDYVMVAIPIELLDKIKKLL